MTDTPDRLSEISARVEAASLGPPWTLDTHDEDCDCGSTLFHNTALVRSGPDDLTRYIDKPTATFIAHSREDIPFLLSLVDSLTKERDGLAADSPLSRDEQTEGAGDE